MLDIIVPVYAKTGMTEEMAREAIAQLKANTLQPHRVIVVENGTMGRARWWGGDMHIVLQENRGYAGGVNSGLAMSTAPMLAVSSIDVFVPPEWDQILVARARTQGGIGSPRARRIQYGVDTGEWEQPGCAYWGGLFAMPRVVYDTIGGLDEERFPLRFSDTDYAVRAARAGFWVGRVERLEVEHRDPSISTLFMDRDDVAAEFERLQEVHGEFPVFEWQPEMWRTG